MDLHQNAAVAANVVAWRSDGGLRAQLEVLAPLTGNKNKKKKRRSPKARLP